MSPATLRNVASHPTLDAKPTPPDTCKQGHRLDEDTVSYRRRGNGWRWECRECARRHMRDYRERQIATLGIDEVNRRERERHKGRVRTPEQMAMKRAADERYRRRKGQQPRDDWMNERRERPEWQKASIRRRQAKVERPPIPSEVRAVWRDAKDGSIIKRLFPTANDLRNAEWDPVHRTIKRRVAA